jgi:hypothetical protein
MRTLLDGFEKREEGLWNAVRKSEIQIGAQQSLTLERSRNFEQDYDFGSEGVCHIYTIKISLMLFLSRY